MRLMSRLMDEVSGEATPAGAPTETPVVTNPNVETPPAATEADVASSNVDWEALSEEALTGDETPSIAPKETPQVEVPPTKVVTTPQQATPTEVAPAPTPQKVEAPATPTPPVAPVAPTQPQPSYEELQRQIQASRTKALRDLETMYKVPEADASQLVAEPEVVIPKLLARAHMAVMDQVANYVKNIFPQMMENVNQTNTRVASTVETFYNEWPELKKPEYAEAVARSLSAYRYANPTAKAEDVIREGGLAALIGLRLPIPDRILKVHNAGAPSATQPSSFTPVSAGSAPSQAPRTPDKNPFVLLAQEDLTEG